VANRQYRVRIWTRAPRLLRLRAAPRRNYRAGLEPWTTG